MLGMSPFSLYAVPAAIITVGAMLYIARAWKYRWWILLTFPVVWWLWKWVMVCVTMLFYMIGVRGLR
jgi:hypothetical protein